MGPPCGEGEAPNPMCPTTDWSDWSPCSVTCGQGVSLRTRFLLVSPELQQKCGMLVRTVEQKTCLEQDCSLTMEQAKGIIKLQNYIGEVRFFYKN